MNSLYLLTFGTLFFGHAVYDKNNFKMYLFLLPTMKLVWSQFVWHSTFFMIKGLFWEIQGE